MGPTLHRRGRAINSTEDVSPERAARPGRAPNNEEWHFRDFTAAASTSIALVLSPVTSQLLQTPS